MDLTPAGLLGLKSGFVAGIVMFRTSLGVISFLDLALDEFRRD